MSKCKTKPALTSVPTDAERIPEVGKRAATPPPAAALPPAPTKVEQTFGYRDPDDIPAVVDPTMTHILSQCRRHDSDTELAFAKWVREEIERRGAIPHVKALGNIVTTILRSDGKPSRVLFSCHIDTVHAGGGTQKLSYDPNFGHIFLDPSVKTGCLGADDGAGVWLLLNMISARVPGTYIFHRGEEGGGKGAWEMHDKDRPFLEQFDLAVAFDRAGDTDIITHQGGVRTCSDKFATALAVALNKHKSMSYSLCPGGSFTDTKVYRGIIPECTNLSVGYESQHGPNETLDYGHLMLLREAVIHTDWDTLPVDREPVMEVSYGKYGAGKWSSGYTPSLYGGDDFYPYSAGTSKPKAGGQIPEVGKRAATTTPAKPKDAAPPVALDAVDEFDGVPFPDVLAYVEEDTASAAMCIIELVAEVRALQEKLRVYKNAIG